MIDGIECAFPATLTKDAEVKETSSGRAFLKLSVTTGKDEKAQHVSVLAWRDTFTEMAPHLTSGARVYVEGRLELRHWNGGSGLSVSASVIQPLGLIGAKKPKAPRKAGKAKVDPQAPIENARPFDDALPF